MRDIKIIHWHNIGVRPELDELESLIITKAIKTDAIGEVAAVFARNARSACRIPMMIFSVFMAGKHLQFAETQATLQLTGKAFLSPEEFGPLDGLAIAELAKKMMYGQQQMPHTKFLRPTPKDFLHDCDAVGMRDELELLMSLQMVSVWTAVETAIADLWETALNEHPIGLANLGGTSKKITLPLLRVQEWKYDLRGKMGTLLRANFLFSGLDGAREAYRAAFHEKGMSVNDAVSNKAFDSASALRHVIVHRAGRCDEDYRRNSDGLPIPQLKIGEQLELDGILLSDVITSCMAATIELIRAVDGWIFGHSLHKETPPE